MSDVVKIRACFEGSKLPALAPCFIQVLDADGDVDLMGFSGRYADKPIWDALRKAGDEVNSPPGTRFEGRFWRIRPADQAGVVQNLSRRAAGWPWLTLDSQWRIVPDYRGAKAPERATKRAALGRCGKVMFQMFDSRDPGAREFAQVWPPPYFVQAPGLGGHILLRASEDGRLPALPEEISADPAVSLIDLPRPAARLRRRGWVMDLVLEGDELAIAATMAGTRPATGHSSGSASSANSFPIVEWPAWRAWLEAGDIQWVAEGFDPNHMWGEVRFDEATIPGWNRPTSAGMALREFQKDGVRFVLSRHGRALLADDMGLGKTAQAVAVAAAMRAEKVLILSPAVVKSVWVEEIKKWDGAGGCEDAIQTLDGSHDRPKEGCKWLIVSYDQVVARAETWKAVDASEFKAVAALIEVRIGFAEDEDDPRPRVMETEKKIKFSRPLPADMVSLVAAELAPASARKWDKLHARLRGELLQALQEWAPGLLVLDEAHRVKSQDAKRTSAAIALSAASGGCLAMSGTPIQNNTTEPAVLLHVLDPAAYREVRHERISVRRIQALLKPVMLRRRKDEVLKELPPLTEQVVHIQAHVDGDDDLAELLAIGESLELKGVKPKDWAAAAPPHIKRLALAWSAGEHLSKFEVIRARLGEAKARASMALDFVKDALENKGCLVVFTGHHAASDALAASIRAAGRKVEVVDGRTSPLRRAQLVSDFQESRLDCLVCGIEAMGEGVTLHRADMVVFLELAYKPSALHQARDRLHRIGQTRNVQAVYLLSSHPMDVFLEMMVLGKADLVGRVLSERVHVLGGERGEDNEAPGAESNGDHGAKALDEMVSNGEIVYAETGVKAESNGELLADPRIVSNGEVVAQVPVASNGDYEAPDEVVRNGELTAQPTPRRGRSALPDEERAARQKESKRKWKATHPQQQTDHSRALAAERVRRWRERHGDEYRAKQRAYVKASRARKRLGGDSPGSKETDSENT